MATSAIAASVRSIVSPNRVLIMNSNTRIVRQSVIRRVCSGRRGVSECNGSDVAKPPHVVRSHNVFWRNHAGACMQSTCGEGERVARLAEAALNRHGRQGRRILAHPHSSPFTNRVAVPCGRRPHPREIACGAGCVLTTKQSFGARGSRRSLGPRQDRVDLRASDWSRGRKAEPIRSNHDGFPRTPQAPISRRSSAIPAPAPTRH